MQVAGGTATVLSLAAGWSEGWDKQVRRNIIMAASHAMTKPRGIYILGLSDAYTHTHKDVYIHSHTYKPLSEQPHPNQ